MKGSITATRFAEVVEKAIINSGKANLNCKKLPIADGGDETAEILTKALKLKEYKFKVRNPLGNPVTAKIGYADGIAVIEMTEASGMKLLTENELNPLLASSYGTGQLLIEAVKLGAKNIYLGIGGSATIDGGTGMLEAIGVKLLNKEGKEIHGNGSNLTEIYTLKTDELKIPLNTKINIICDVNNTLLGKNGAAHIFGPQKGATPEMVKFLDKGLKNLANVIHKQSGIDTSKISGSGAAGGVAIGLYTFFNAQILSGANFIFDLLNLDEHLLWSDVVITGEGKLDHQTLNNKAPYLIAVKAKKAGVPVYAIVGQNHLNNNSLFKKVFSLSVNNQSVEYALKNTEMLIYQNTLGIINELN